MSIRPITVYFDTNFFVWLASAKDPLAEQVLSRLKRLRVSYVLCPVVLRELLTFVGAPDAGPRLLARLDSLESSPRRLKTPADFRLLLLTGEARQNAAADIRDTNRAFTDAEAKAHLAHLSHETKYSQKVMEAFGFIDADLPSVEEHLNFARPRVEGFVQLFRDFGLNDIATQLWEQFNKLDSVELSPEVGATIYELLHEGLRKLSPYNYERATEQRRVSRPILEDDNRPFMIAKGDEAALDKLGNTVRDIERMNLFILHQNEVDFLQLDGPQFRQMNAKPSSRLRILGLDKRCFTAVSFDVVGDEVERLEKAL